MKYHNLTQEQQDQELKGRITSLERRHYLRTLDLKEAEALAENVSGEELKERMVSVGQIMLDLRSIETSLAALHGK